MGVKITGNFLSAERLEVLIEQAGERVRKHAIEHMRKEAEEIAELAREYAPFDEGKLEKAIKVEDGGGGRDDRGRLQRKSVSVYVDDSMPGSGGAATVGQYSYLIHEGLEPEGGAFDRREGSNRKMERNGKLVGGGFLRRALQDKAKEVISKTGAVLKRFLS